MATDSVSTPKGESQALASLTEYMQVNYKSLPRSVRKSFAKFAAERAKGEHSDKEAKAFDKFIKSVTKKETKLPEGAAELINEYKTAREAGAAAATTAAYDYSNVGNVDAYGNVPPKSPLTSLLTEDEKPAPDVNGANQTKGIDTGDPFLDLFLTCLSVYMNAYEEDMKHQKEAADLLREEIKKALKLDKIDSKIDEHQLLSDLENGKYNGLYNADVKAKNSEQNTNIGADYNQEVSAGAKEIINQKVEDVLQKMEDMGYNVSRSSNAPAKDTASDNKITSISAEQLILYANKNQRS